MASIQTTRFGVLEVEQGSILQFPQGLPGFENDRRFVLVEQAELAPVACLQSLDSPGLCLWVAPVRAIAPGYRMGITPEDLLLLGLDQARQPLPGEEVLCMAILCAPENGPLTANLLAPVVVNLETRTAVQAVRVDNQYSCQHLLGTGGEC